jgi:hypothetical protein
MKRLFRSLLVISLLSPLALLAGEKANTVLLHPGEVVYAKFTQKGKKLTLVGTSKEKDETAQVILTMSKTAPAEAGLLEVQNKLAQDLVYRLEIRSLTLKRRIILPVVPVVAGKLSREELPPYIEQMAVFAFELAR